MKRLIVLVLFTLLVPVAVSASGDNAFFRDLSDRKEVRLDDVATALSLLLNGPADREFADRLGFLKEKGIVDPSTPEEADVRLSKGTIAVMFVRALGIKGGILLRIFPNNQRYALKELVYLKIMGPGNVNQWIDGASLISILSRAVEYREGDE